MTSPLAKIYSTADSWKRALSDMLTNPVLHAQKSISYGAEKLNKLSADSYTGNSKSVLIPPTQKEAARVRATDSMTNFMAGFGGIIVPVDELGSAALRAASIPHAQPKTGRRVAAVPQHSQRLNRDMLQVVGVDDAGRSLVEVMPGGTAADLFVSHSVIPRSLLEFLSNIPVAPSGKYRGGAYYPNEMKMVLGSNTPEKLLSTLLHESTHASQHLYDMPMGGSPRDFFRDYGKFTAAQELVSKRLKEAKVAGVDFSMPVESLGGTRDEMLKDPQVLKFLHNNLREKYMTAYDRYRNIAGEAEARLAQHLYETRNYVDPIVRLQSEMGVKPSELIMREQAKTMRVDTDLATQDLVNMILGYPAAGAKP